MVCRKTLLIIACLVSGMIGLNAMAEPVLQPFDYREGFEDASPELKLWAGSGDAEVNFIGPTEEMASEGKRSFKLDVTLKSGGYQYYGVPVRVPCIGKLRISARVRVGEGTTARVGFGDNYVYPPSSHSGCAPYETYSSPMTEWKTIERDLVATAGASAEAVMTRVTATVNMEHVVPTLDRWAIFVHGSAGQRAVIYVDDIRIQGEVPDPQSLDALAEERWENGQKAFRKRLETWRNALSAAEKGLPLQISPGLESLAERARDTVAKTRDVIGGLAGQGWATRDDVRSVEASIDALRYAKDLFGAHSNASRHPCIIFTPRAITNDRPYTDVFPLPIPIGKSLACSGCPGEYESVTAIAFALQDVKDLLVSVSDLKGPGGRIPASAVDVRVVKSWFQAGKEIWDLKDKTLVRELLLKDDDLVRVDIDKGENYLRSTSPDGEHTYLLCSGPTSENLAQARPIDARELQPVDIPVNGLKEFWMTIHIPDNAKPGVYIGEVSFNSKQGTQSIPLEVTVHPFELAASRLRYSLYYRACLSPDGEPAITSESKSEEQYRVEIADMKAHGVLYPTNYIGANLPEPPHGPKSSLRRALEIRQELGMPTGCFYNLGQLIGAPEDSAGIAALKISVRRWLNILRPFGYHEVYFYGRDEARGERLTAQRAAWKAVQDAGGKTFVAGYAGTFEAMGGLLDCAVLAGKPDPEEARKWHSVGSHAFCYGYPQVGNEEPETYRRNFGLVLRKAGFDGAMNYAYQHAFDHVWNDFDNAECRDHNFTYPTMDGIVGTIQWEGFREGVDDVRYATTLEQAIENAPATHRSLAEEARRWLDALDPVKADLYETRARMVEWILQLKQK